MANSVVSVIATAIEKQRKGYFGLSLSGMETTSAPTIISGSVIEIGGSVYLYSADEAINATSWTAITTATPAYIELTASGTSLTGAYTDNAPVWREDYNGWYHSAGSSIRVIAGVYKNSITSYQHKYYFAGTVPGLTFDATKGVIQSRKYITVNRASIKLTGFWDGSAVFDFFDDYIPEDGDYVGCNFQTIIATGTTPYGSFQGVYAERNGATQIYIRGVYTLLPGASCGTGVILLQSSTVGTIVYKGLSTQIGEGYSGYYRLSP